jgi:protein gp37
METINWKLTSGCTTLGGGCDSCPSLWEYREKGWDYTLMRHPGELYIPKARREPAVYTVSLGSDLFHEAAPDEFIKDAFDVMNECDQHFFEIATKRVERMERLAPKLEWTKNIAAGITVESEAEAWRIKHLQAVPAAVRFISFLPLLGDIGTVDLKGIHFTTIGPELWGLKRPCNEAWVGGIYKQARDQGVQVIENYRFYDFEEKIKCQE